VLLSPLYIPQQKSKDNIAINPICTHLSNMGIFVYHLSEANAEAGSVNRIVQMIIQIRAGKKKRF
jgi:hypothetical protein